MARFENPTFERLADSLGVPLVCVSSRSFSLVFEGGLPVTLGLHPNGTDVAIDVWCFDLAPQTGAQRRAILKALLLLNHASWAGQGLGIALDSRDFVLLHGHRDMARLGGGAFAVWLSWHVEQGRRVRELSRTLVCGFDAEVARFT